MGQMLIMDKINNIKIVYEYCIVNRRWFRQSHGTGYSQAVYACRQLPHHYPYDDVFSKAPRHTGNSSCLSAIAAHEQARVMGITDSVASCTLIAEVGGKDMHVVPGSEKNIKITTVEDLEILKALMHTSKEEWLK